MNIFDYGMEVAIANENPNYLLSISGPTEENPEDPFVLVGAAHCNYICKDSDSGNTLETCCCRTENSTATCNSEVIAHQAGGKFSFKCVLH